MKPRHNKIDQYFWKNILDDWHTKGTKQDPRDWLRTWCNQPKRAPDQKTEVSYSYPNWRVLYLDFEVLKNLQNLWLWVKNTGYLKNPGLVKGKNRPDRHLWSCLGFSLWPTVSGRSPKGWWRNLAALGQPGFCFLPNSSKALPNRSK